MLDQPIRLGSYKITANGCDVAFAVALAVFCVWYLFDARAASTSAQNLLLIQPLVIVAVALALRIVIGAIRIERLEDSVGPGGSPIAGAGDERQERRASLRIGAFMALFGLHVFFMERVGFDLATFVFIAAGLLIQGERRPSVVLGFSFVFTAVAVYLFKALLPLPVPTALLPGL